MIVVDSNIIAARNLTSVRTSKAEQVEKKDPVWIVPVLWRYEFQNILATAIKAKQITPEYALDVWQRVAEILVENESEPSPAKVIDLVAKYGITAYDGQFIALAKVPVPIIHKAGGKWNTFLITAKGPELTVVFNGVVTVNVRDSKLAEGTFALQYAGGPIKWRKVQVRPL